MGKRGVFIVIDGPDGGGKTTQIPLLANYFKSQGLYVVETKEPGGSDPICSDIRNLLLNPKHSGKMDGWSELFLFFANRAQHVANIIRPALANGAIVISDRYAASSFAYQCYSRGICAPEEYLKIHNLATRGLNPDFTAWIDISVSAGSTRNKKHGKIDRLELESVAFHEKVREGFHVYFQKIIKDSQSWQRFDGTISIQNLTTTLILSIKEQRLI